MAHRLRRSSRERSTTGRALREVFLTRSRPALEQLAARADPATLRKALAAPSDVGGIARLLSDLLGSAVAIDAVDPLAAAIARGTQRKERLLTAAGGGGVQHRASGEAPRHLPTGGRQTAPVARPAGRPQWHR